MSDMLYPQHMWYSPLVQGLACLPPMMPHIACMQQQFHLYFGESLSQLLVTNSVCITQHSDQHHTAVQKNGMQF